MRGAPREGTVITIDVSSNQAYLFEDGELIKLKAVYKAAEVGTDVYIFDSGTQQTAEKHSDLDYPKD